ncbi:leucine rich adaptor protein 1 [Lampris incognitus]|uniref:leucine rich adaptor protein 1 n=1 Tax=Lampris incognitus TaxID=2546036 RepID=UPI0024B5DF97|nr:leucine rich adaptor protein 1 [Lampris incognitus]
MDEGTASEAIPDLRDIEVKIGRKTPEGLLKWLRDEASFHRGDAKLSAANDARKERDTGKKSLDEKIRKLKVEMAHLRSVDVKILQQLLAVHEGIEAVKWLLEERSTLTSRCSSLTSSQYSLGEGPDTSWRGSWSSLQDPHDKLDNISVGSFLDTLADDMDEYGPSSSESVICSATPLASEAAGCCSRIVGGAGVGPKSRNMVSGANGDGVETAVEVKSGTEVKAKAGGAVNGVAAPGKPAVSGNAPQAKSDGPKQEAPTWTKAIEMGKNISLAKDNSQTQAIKINRMQEKSAKQITSAADSTQPCLTDKNGKSQSPKFKPYINGKIDLETCKMNGKIHLEYDAHWRWVQSQEDVTFL